MFFIFKASFQLLVLKDWGLVGHMSFTWYNYEGKKSGQLLCSIHAKDIALITTFLLFMFCNTWILYWLNRSRFHITVSWIDSCNGNHVFGSVVLFWTSLSWIATLIVCLLLIFSVILSSSCHLILGEVHEAMEYYNNCLESGNKVCLDRRFTIEAADGLQKAQVEVYFPHDPQFALLYCHLKEKGEKSYSFNLLPWFGCWNMELSVPFYCLISFC